MYGLSDQSNGMPRTRLSAVRHGSSRYSERTARSLANACSPSGDGHPGARAGPAGPLPILSAAGGRRRAQYRRPGDRGMTLALLLLAVAALILLNGFFVAAEYGLVTARMTRLQELADEGVRRARIVLRIIGDPPRFIAAMQLGVTATSLAIGALGEPVLERIFHPVVAAVVAVILAFLIITFLHVVIGELIPKGVALAYSERVALAVAAPVRGFFVLFHPLIWVLQRASEAGLRALGLQPPTGEVGVLSEAELKMLLSRSSEEGEIEHEEREMLYNVFDFADKEVSDVMVPRPEVVALSIDLPPEECLKAAVESPYTRYPVYRGSLDEIVGILHV